jgi:hypothetical protein
MCAVAMVRSAAGVIRSRRLLAILVCAIAGCLVPATILAAPSSASTAAKRHKQVHRVGGKVHRAWPQAGKAPRSALARWLARQVGPTKVKPCERPIKGKLVHCRRATPPHPGALPPHPSGDFAVAADSGSLGPLATAAQVPTGSSTLQLERSYLIPADDPSYTRLLNWSWTYDSALTAMAFSVVGREGRRPSSCSTSWPPYSTPTDRSNRRSTLPTGPPSRYSGQG